MATEDKKTKIINAALKLFSTQGFHQTTVSEIAERANVAKGTVYWYFDSKEQLFEAILITEINKTRSKTATKVKKLDDPIAKLEVVIKSHLQFYNQARDVAKMYRESTITIREEFKEKMLALHQEQIDFLIEIIKLGQKKEIFSQEINLEDTAYLINGMLNSFHPHIHNQKEFEITNKLESTKSLLFNGLLA